MRLKAEAEALLADARKESGKADAAVSDADSAADSEVNK